MVQVLHANLKLVCSAYTKATISKWPWIQITRMVMLFMSGTPHFTCSGWKAASVRRHGRAVIRAGPELARTEPLPSFAFAVFKSSSLPLSTPVLLS